MSLVLPLSENVRPRPIAFSQEYQHRTLAEDREIIERIIAAYHHAIGSAPPEIRRSMCGTIWGEHGFVGKQGGLIQALEEKSPARLHDILRQYFRTDAAHGIAMGRDEADVVSTRPEQAHCYGLVWLDRLVGLSFAVGALPVPHPEDNSEGWQRCLEVDPEQVIAAVEDKIGLPLTFPNLCGVFGGRIRDQIFPFIAFTHLLVALTMRMLVHHEQPTIFEIGGGFGGLAYFVAQLLPCRYTIFDLPYTGAVQAYFLGRALSDRKLVLPGELDDGSAGITLLPAWAIRERPPATTADLVVNQDSMSEIPRSVARSYLEAMKKLLRGPFLSVNHESPARESVTEVWDRDSVARLVEGVGGYTRFSRAPFFLRLGYVQEIYYPTAHTPGRTLARHTAWK